MSKSEKCILIVFSLKNNTRRTVLYVNSKCTGLLVLVLSFLLKNADLDDGATHLRSIKLAIAYHQSLIA